LKNSLGALRSVLGAIKIVSSSTLRNVKILISFEMLLSSGLLVLRI
jgi:hypothetical protein